MAHKIPTASDYRKFGLFLAGLFIVAGLVPLLRGHPVRWWAEGVGALFALVSLAYPKALRPLYRVSLKVGGVLGWINTRILLSVLFYGILTPIGLVLRWTRRGGTSWRGRAGSPTYWHQREKVDLQNQMRHLF